MNSIATLCMAFVSWILKFFPGFTHNQAELEHAVELAKLQTLEKQQADEEVEIEAELAELDAIYDRAEVRDVEEVEKINVSMRERLATVLIPKRDEHANLLEMTKKAEIVVETIEASVAYNERLLDFATKARNDTAGANALMEHISEVIAYKCRNLHDPYAFLWAHKQSRREKVLWKRKQDREQILADKFTEGLRPIRSELTEYLQSLETISQGFVEFARLQAIDFTRRHVPKETTSEQG